MENCIKYNKIFESAGAILTETEDDTIYGSKVAVDAVAENEIIDDRVEKLTAKLQALQAEIKALFNNSHDALVEYSKNGGMNELYSLYTAVYGSLGPEADDDFYAEYFRPVE